jgi:hypothetical protein
MQESMLAALCVRRPQIRRRWEDLLRVERASSPLADPDSLVHMIDWSLDEIFRTMPALPARRRHVRPVTSADCPCGRNPLLAYFAAGEQALREALVMAQVEIQNLTPVERDSALSDLDYTLRQLSRREIESFCAICQFRPRDAVAETAGAVAIR